MKKPKFPLLNLEYDWMALRAPLAERCSELPQVLLETIGVTDSTFGLRPWKMSVRDFFPGRERHCERVRVRLV